MSTVADTELKDRVRQRVGRRIRNPRSASRATGSDGADDGELERD